MYKRDFAVLFLSVCAIYLSMQQEGPFTFRKAWYHHFPSVVEDSDILPQHHAHLPAPLAADLNGDGKPELLIFSPTPRPQLQLIAPRHAGDGFAPALVLHEIDLAAALERPEGRKTPGIVAMSSGYLTAPAKELVRAPRKQVVAVVTTDGEAMLLDHNLRPLWRQRVVASSSTNDEDQQQGQEQVRLHEAAVLITSHAASKGDRGMVVIGTRPTARHVPFDDYDYSEDFMDRELELEEDDEAHARGRGAADGLKEVDASRHFSYIAFAGGSGEVRWRHGAEDFHRDLASLNDATVATQHGLHAAAQLQEGRHYGEASCRDYRESVLAVLPHAWASPRDTHLHLAHFHRHRSHSGAQKAQLASLAATRHLNGAPPVVPRATTTNNNNNNKHRKHHVPPNVLVAHTEEGLEAIHLYSGRTVCRLHLAAHALHADLNGDGVPDHAKAVGGDPADVYEEAAEEDADRNMAHAHLKYCYAIVTSGIPPRQPLFNGTICRSMRGQLQRLRQAGYIDVAVPVSIPLPGRHGHYRSTAPLRQKSAAIFLTSNGDLTAYASDGEMLWQAFTGVTWRTQAELVEGYDHGDDALYEEFEPSTPTLVALSLRRHAVASAVLVAGDEHGTVVSEHGRELAWFELAEKPSQPLIALDFNLDGYTDFVQVGSSGIYGWAQVRRPGAVPFSALVGGLIVTMLAVFVTQQGMLQPVRKPKGRSTERVD